MPQFLRYPVGSVDDFRRFWRERMRTGLEERIGGNWREQIGRHRLRDYPLVVIADRWGGFFGPCETLSASSAFASCFTTTRFSSRR